MSDWQEKTLAHWDLINRLAGRRFGDRILAEEAALAVFDGLRQDDWQRLRTYSGVSTFAAFLATLTCRLLEDFARSRFGRIRPPTWVRRLGATWVDLFRLLCLERLPLAEAVESLAVRRANEDRRDLENAAYLIRGEIVDCGQHQGLEVALDEEIDHSTTPEDGSEPEEKLLTAERRRVFELVCTALLGTDPELSEEGLAGLLSLQLELQPEEKLLLKLCYRDGLPLPQVGEMLGLNRFQLHGRLRRLLARLRAEFEQAGLAPEVINLLRA